MTYSFSYPKNIKIEEITEKLNNVEASNTIPFVDILIIEPQNDLTFEVYHKPTNKYDYIHFYSYHNDRIKTGLIIGHLSTST